MLKNNKHIVGLRREIKSLRSVVNSLDNSLDKANSRISELEGQIKPKESDIDNYDLYRLYHIRMWDVYSLSEHEQSKKVDPLTIREELDQIKEIVGIEEKVTVAKAERKLVKKPTKRKTTKKKATKKGKK